MRRGWLLSLSVATVLLSASLKCLAAGWVVLTLGPFYIFICFSHLFAHWFSMRRGHTDIGLWLVSNVLLLVAFLLQHDAGDGAGFLTITVILMGEPGSASAQPPSWWPHGFLANLVLFVPVLVTWFALVARWDAGDAQS